MDKDYFSFVLRLWRAGADGEEAWHASVEEILTGERRAFADLGVLLAYLRAQTGAGSPPEGSGGDMDKREEVGR